MKALTYVTLTFLVALTCAAQEPGDEAIQLDDTVVTATRTNRPLDKVASSVTVITAEEIQAKGHVTVADILVGQPGIDLARNGGPGTNTSIFMRGADSKNVLLLIDGTPFNDASSPNRNPSFAQLATTNIERIEIIRGPQSVLYGSNATAGVINIITKSGDGEPTFTVRGEGGSFGHFRTGVSAFGKAERVGYSLSLDYIDRDGFSIANENNSGLPNDGNNTEDDGYRNLNFSGKIDFEITEDFDISLSGRYMDAETDIDDFGPGYAGDEFTGFPATAVPNGQHEQRADEENRTFRLDIRNRFGDGLFDSRLYGSYSEMDRQNFDANGNPSFDAMGETRQYGWQGNLYTESGSIFNTLSLGVEYVEEKSDSSTASQQNADTFSLWIQEQFELDAFYAVVGARYDDHDRFGDHVTWRLAPAYRFEETGTKLKASYGTGFRAPSLFELFADPWGNPNLEPEESEGWDLGIEQEIGDSLTLGVTYFDTVFDNRIAFVFAQGGYVQADGDTKTKGVEIFAEWQAAESLRFTANYTYTNTEDPDGNELVRRPERKANLTTYFKPIDKVNVTLDINFVGQRDETTFAADKDGNPVDLDDYILVNLSVDYTLNEYVRIFGRVDNVTDEFYETAWSYAMPERSFYVGTEITF